MRTLETWPPVGLPDKPWLDDPDADVLARTVGGVCELYSRALAALEIPAPSSTVRATIRPPDVFAAQRAFLVTVVAQRFEGFEMASWQPPEGFRALPWARRRRTVLDAAHVTLAALAPHRGWDVERLREAHRQLFDHDLVLRWTSPWKAPPDRRHRARAVFGMREDGFGDAVVEIARRVDETAVAATAPVLAYCSLPGWQRGASTLRWNGSSELSFAPFVDTLGRTTGTVSLSLDAGVPAAVELPPIAHESPPGDVEVSIVVEPHPDEVSGPRILVIGGGPMNDVPEAYERELDKLLNRMTRNEWIVWWSGADREVLELWYDFEPTRPGPAVRRTKEKVKATICRPVRDLVNDPDPVGIARRDVEVLVAAIRARAGLPPPPPLN